MFEQQRSVIEGLKRTLSEAQLRQVRTASVPPRARALITRLPTSMTVDVVVGEGGAPGSVLQLLKLALSAERLALGRVERGAWGAACVRGQVGELEATLRDEALVRPLFDVLRELVEALYDERARSALLEAFVFRASVFETLQQLTSHMLRASDTEHALHILLTGLTSGAALGFNRAALFTYDAQDEGFVGAWALGPLDQAEALQIWEQMALDACEVEAALSERARRQARTRLQTRVRTVRLGTDDPLVREALATGAPVRQRRGAAPGSWQAALDAVGPFLLAPLVGHGRALGLVFADNRFDGRPIDDEHLSVFSYFIDQAALIWENHQLIARIERQARTDALTGLLNRHALESERAALVGKARVSGAPLSMLILDLDRFKLVNDGQGHEAGDAMLRAVGALLSAQAPRGWVAGRFGGDEFVALLPGVGAAALREQLERLGREASRRAIRVSVGAASWPEDLDDPDRLLSMADARLYEAKRAGGGCGACGGPPIAFEA